MISFKSFAIGLLAALAVTVTTPKADAASFDFTFLLGSTTAGMTTVGTGSFSFDDPAGGPVGTFDVFGLTNVSMAFTLGSSVFDQDDIFTTSGASVILAGTPGSRTLQFTGIGTPAITTRGSLEFQQGTALLAFGRTSLEGLFGINTSTLSANGSYTAVESAPVIPLPAAGPLLALDAASLFGAAAVARLRRA